MKRKQLIGTLLLCSSLLTACGSSSTIKLVDGSDDIVATTNSAVTNTTLQSIYDSLYASSGTTTATNEIIYQLGVQAFKDSGRAQSEWDERVASEINTAFSSSYMIDNKYVEALFAASLKAKGYTITCPSGTFTGTGEDFPEYNNLYSALKCNYSDYITKVVDRNVATAFLREEYILNEKSVYFTNKVIRRMQYFKFSPLTYVDQDKYSVLFEQYVKNAGSTDFETIALGTGGLDEQWREVKRDDEAESFALIDYKKSTKYADLYKNIFDMSEYSSTVQSSLKSEVSEYSNSGKQSIFKGYELKLLDLQNQFYYYDVYGTNEGSTYIYSDMDTKVFKEGTSLLLDDNGYLLVQAGGTSICHNSDDGNYYIIKVTEINASSSIEEKRAAAQALSKNSSNYRNAILFYLEKYGVTVHESDLYDYINTTYSYEAK